MSTWAMRAVRCPCGHTQDAQLADGLHITRLPEVRARILDGTFHHVACRGCRRISVVEQKTLYTDFDRYHWVAVAPPWTIAAWPDWVAALEHEFDHNMRVAAPPMVRELADRFKVRLVFGLDALAEKLVAWDAGLDDRLVEALKLRLRAARPDQTPPDSRMRLVAVHRDRWALTLRITAPERDPVDVSVSLDAYLLAERHRAEAPPEVLAAPFGGLDRLFAPALAAATPMASRMHVVAPMRPFDDAPAVFARPGYPAASGSEQALEPGHG
jgi:hypothetical protein